MLGFSVLYQRKKQGEIVMDERDTMIQLKSSRIAFAIFWVVFVISCLIVSTIYRASGVVPIWIVQASVWCGFMLLWAVMSLAILVQYRKA